MDKVVVHLGETTGDASLAKLQELVLHVTGQPEPTQEWCRRLRFRVKLSGCNSHGHERRGVGRPKRAASAKRVGAEAGRRLGQGSLVIIYPWIKMV